MDKLMKEREVEENEDQSESPERNSEVNESEDRVEHETQADDGDKHEKVNKSRTNKKRKQPQG